MGTVLFINVLLFLFVFIDNNCPNLREIVSPGSFHPTRDRALTFAAATMLPGLKKGAEAGQGEMVDTHRWGGRQQAPVRSATNPGMEKDEMGSGGERGWDWKVCGRGAGGVGVAEDASSCTWMRQWSRHELWKEVARRRTATGGGGLNTREACLTGKGVEVL